MPEQADETWPPYLKEFALRMGTPLTQIVGYSGMLALMIQDLKPEAALEMIQDIQRASQELIDLRNELVVQLPDPPNPPTEKKVSADAVDQKWRELVNGFLSTWSLPLMVVLSNTQMIETFLEALAQRDNTPITIESGSFKTDLTPHAMLDLIRHVRENAQEMSRLKYHVYENFDKPYNESTQE